ncbi:MAG: NAD-dependent epimerase/dehydratase family protein [Spirochaetales bacterium]|nr:NAD-dependent epimerase/dehydratase family protein [Spirochaetales bacterium]
MINIIGGSGFIGTHLATRLIKQNKFTIIDKNKSLTFPKLWKKADIRNLNELQEVIDENSIIINLAAEHKDNVEPKSLYDEVNVQGAKNICQVAREKNVKKIIFTSSVAVYGFALLGTDESGEINYFNDYGRTKWEAEQIYKAWANEDPERTLVIIRPTVVFGERNRGNVYNLLKQIVSGKFLMVGNGKNKKSMAYVENVAAFIEYSISHFKPGIHIFNYIDKPDFTMNELVSKVNKIIKGKKSTGFHFPYFAGYLGGIFFDILSKVTGKEFPVSAIRVKKFASNTLFSSSIQEKTNFVPPVEMDQALTNTINFEFLNTKSDGPVFYSE